MKEFIYLCVCMVSFFIIATMLLFAFNCESVTGFLICMSLATIVSTHISEFISNKFK